MCLIVEKGTPIQILKKDKIVYKEMSFGIDADRVFSYFREYEYKIGELQPKQSLKLEEDISKMADNAQFCDDKDTKTYCRCAFELRDLIRIGKLVSYEEGYHFFRTKKRAKSELMGTLYKCKIPTGEEVIYNKSNLGIASNIIILGAVE